MRATFYDPVDPAMMPFQIPQAVVAVCRKLNGAVMTPQAALKKIRAAAGTFGEVSLEEGYISLTYKEYWSRFQEAFARLLFPTGEFDASEDCEAGMVYDQESGTKKPVTLAELYAGTRDAEKAVRCTAQHYAALIRFRS